MRWLAHIPPRVALLLGVMALGMVGVVQADSRSQPLTPAAFYGILTIAGSDAVVDTVVCGRIGGVDKGCITTTVSGQYGGAGGGDPKLIVQSVPEDIDATIEFFVTPPGTVGGLAAQTALYVPEDVTELNLTLATAPAAVPGPGPGPGPAPEPDLPPPVALAVLSGLNVFPLEITASGSVTITVVIASAGTAPLNTTVTITVAGQTQTFTIVGLAPGTSQTLSATFTIDTPGSYVVTVTETSLAPLSGEVDVVPPEEVSQTQELVITTSVVITEEQVTVITTVLNAALGIELGAEDAVVAVATTTELVVVAPRTITTSIEITGLQAGAEIVGDVDITVGNITVETTDGVGTGQIVLAEGLTVVGNVTLVAEDGVLDIIFEDTRLLVEPEAPPALLGGSAAVTHIDVTFDVGLENLPEGASLEIEFAKTADAFVPDAGAIFQLAAEQVLGLGQGRIADLIEDIAFVVQVTRVGIENTDFGDNTITMEISRGWYEARIAQGKTIVITKIADDGTVTAAEAACVVSGDIATCQVTFTGDAGGFSVFVVLAVAQAPVPTPTPTATPRPTPTTGPPPTATPTTAALPTATARPPATAPPLPPGVTATPTPVEEPTATPTAPPVVVPTATPAPPPAEGGGGALIFIIIGAVVLIGGGAAAFFVLRGRGS